jgi:catechol 2,3-dioxygenase-like lactoylglutathione lyase family enzyme
MEIRQFRVTLRAADFERTCRFYGTVLALPRVREWDHEEGRGAQFQSGPSLIEILGRAQGSEKGRDESFDYQGPKQKMVLGFDVPSAERAYEELIFREKNIPGGLKLTSDGTMVFETHDPDGVKIVLRQQES